MSVSDRTLTKQNRCPLKCSGLKHGRRESKIKEIKSISTHSAGSKWREKIYCILL